ncbi:MAG: HNH endonuclease [Candidatus Electrothrix sp. GW3-4]|uniref:HNH endonuclease n=1 Tax=Candidatus Electrothrix sp. GW3-4 TaxID=3126740 RepID=UPI0030D5EB47
MMNEDFIYGFGVDDSTIRAERRKARELRKTRWWQQKTADGICHYCQRKFPVKELTMDHIIPLSRGGRSTKGNLVPCCKTCNTAKKTDLPPELEEL